MTCLSLTRTAAALMLTAGSAMAGSLSEPVVAPPVAAPAPAETSRQAYAFGSLAYVLSDVEYEDIGASASTSIDLDGAAVTLGLGHMWTRGDWSIAVELDATSGTGPSPVIFGATPCAAGFAGCSGTMDWLATLRLVLGRDYGAYHPYVTAGVAAASLSGTASASGCGGGVDSCTFQDTLTGLVVGLGVKRQLKNNWFLRGEYLYADLGDAAFTTSNVIGSHRFGVLRIGIEHRF